MPVLVGFAPEVFDAVLDLTEPFDGYDIAANDTEAGDGVAKISWGAVSEAGGSAPDAPVTASRRRDEDRRGPSTDRENHFAVPASR
jgi:hypothetical protein